MSSPRAEKSQCRIPSSFGNIYLSCSQCNSWLCFQETISVINRGNKMILQILETSICISQAVPVSCSGYIVFWTFLENYNKFRPFTGIKCHPALKALAIILLKCETMNKHSFSTLQYYFHFLFFIL